MKTGSWAGSDPLTLISHHIMWLIRQLVCGAILLGFHCPTAKCTKTELFTVHVYNKHKGSDWSQAMTVNWQVKQWDCIKYFYFICGEYCIEFTPLHSSVVSSYVTHVLYQSWCSRTRRSDPHFFLFAPLPTMQYDNRQSAQWFRCVMIVVAYEASSRDEVKAQRL